MNSSNREPLPLADAVERVAASVVGVVARRQRGAAVVWREGVAVTSASNLWRARGVAAVLPDGEQVDATVRGIDAATDLAVVSFADRGVPPVARDGEAGVRVGDVVFAVGREPSGAVQASFGHVGAVAGAWRSWRGGAIERLIRLDGGLYPGLAGAAVSDATGRLLGVASPMFSRHHGVVLPVATVERVVEQLLTHGRVRQGYLGIAAQPVRAQRDGVGVDGLLVSSVADDGPAARAGLLVGDVIVALGGHGVNSLEALRERLQVGARVEIAIARGGRAQTLAMQVAERPHAHCG
ncbi:MAG TPA: trypsin-like peptidase domain-containing protein [Burkholderiaceae bacterium]|nr:trypsin-like peptidase domain-containing protein [Burkholderiaceae bacterium]